MDESSVWYTDAAQYLDCNWWRTVATIFLITATNSDGNDYRQQKGPDYK